MTDDEKIRDLKEQIYHLEGDVINWKWRFKDIRFKYDILQTVAKRWKEKHDNICNDNEKLRQEIDQLRYKLDI